MKKIILLIGSFFYIGFLPLIPGTFGSIAGAVLYYLTRNTPLIYYSSTLGLLILGLYSCGKAERELGRKDSPVIVIDEVIGMLVSFIFIPYDFRLLIAGFFIFRLLDTVKPYPASVLQHIEGSTGILIDDIIAGLYTNIVLQVVLRTASFKAS